MGSPVAAVVLSLLSLTVAACDASFTSDAPSAECREAGAQCALPSGPLGVCERSTCAAGETPPCFQCTPQH